MRVTRAVSHDEKTRIATTAAAAEVRNDSSRCLKSNRRQLLTVIHNPLQALFLHKSNISERINPEIRSPEKSFNYSDTVALSQT
jgi:hypothetical protein